MAKWIISGIVILLAVWPSFQLVQYLNDSQIITEKASNLISPTADENEFHSDELAETNPRKRVCKDHSLGALKKKPTRKIYKWEDKKGVVNFSAL